MKEARTTRVVGPHTEFQASGARRSAARRNLRPQGPLMELLSAMISFPLRIANVNAIKCRARCAAAQTAARERSGVDKAQPSSRNEMDARQIESPP